MNPLKKLLDSIARYLVWTPKEPLGAPAENILPQGDQVVAWVASRERVNFQNGSPSFHHTSTAPKQRWRRRRQRTAMQRNYPALKRQP